MKRTKPGWRALASMTVLLAGCTTLLDGKYDFQDGWRAAKVIQIAPLARIQRPYFHLCTRNASSEQRAGGEFAILSYKNMGKQRQHAMPLLPNSGLQIGAKVYANMDSCDGRIVPRHD